MELRYKRTALRYLGKVPKSKSALFFKAFNRIAEGDTEGLNISPFQGLKNGYRLRIGDYRAIYIIFKNKLLVEVIKVGSRGDIYK